MPDPKTPDDSPESPAEDYTDEFDKRLAKAYGDVNWSEGRRVQGVEQPSIHVNSARCASVTGNAVLIFVKHSRKSVPPHTEISISHDGMGP
jgi:hypothetical protein